MLINKETVCVITGASSGIGRATALKFAGKGTTLVLAARNEEALQEVSRECMRQGAKTLVVPTDVTDHRAMEGLAQTTVEHFGHISVWINNAAVSLFARIEEAPYECYRQVIETNLFGCVHGARASLPLFKRQEHGTLINIASMLGKIGAPFVSAYVASKFAIVGLSESLRQELVDYPNIHVCTVLPASIDTPFFQHAANFTGRAVKPMQPVYDVEVVAEALLHLIEKPQRELVVGNAGKFFLMSHGLAPAMTEKIMARQVEKDHFQDKASKASNGNLFAPMTEISGERGGWQSEKSTA